MKRRWFIVGTLLMASLLSLSVAKVKSGTFFGSGTITSTGNSGWMSGESYEKAAFTIVPANLATDELLDVTIETAWTSTGGGAQTVVTFTQVTSTNAVETKQVANPQPGYWRVNWTVAGTTPSMDFTLYKASVP